jgi:hypothetical protein
MPDRLQDLAELEAEIEPGLGGDRQTSSHVTVVSQNRFIYAENSATGVKTRKSGLGSNTRGNRVISVVELTRIELATS